VRALDGKGVTTTAIGHLPRLSRLLVLRFAELFEQIKLASSKMTAGGLRMRTSLRSSLRRVFRRRLLQKLDQWLARVGRLNLAILHDFLGTEFFPVEILIAAIV